MPQYVLVTVRDLVERLLSTDGWDVVMEDERWSSSTSILRRARHRQGTGGTRQRTRWPAKRGTEASH